MYWNRFDICIAWYVFWKDFHDGQWSYGYKKLSQLTRIGFKPGLSAQYGKLDNPNQCAIYHNLYAKYVL